MKVLKKGSRGNDVKKWQSFLIKQDFNPGDADGIFGPLTHDATVKFQKKYGLKQDGKVGKNTFTKAEELGYDSLEKKMKDAKLTESLKQEYRGLFDTCVIKRNRKPEVDTIVEKIVKNQKRYETVAEPLKIPWYFVAVIHSMESSMNFKTHLHNGDSLKKRTVHVPAGRPKSGSPPFTWEESAKDALKYKKLDKWDDWSISGILYKLEEYNGWGYRKYHPDVLTPYLWSFSNHYTKGKYVSDGSFSDTAVSGQCGAAVLIRRLAEEGHIALTGEPVSKTAEPREIFSKSYFEDLKYSEYKNIFKKYLSDLKGTKWLRDKDIKWIDNEGTINVIVIRCNDYYITNDMKRNNDWMIVIENRPDDNFRRYVFNCTADPKSKKRHRANLCEQIYFGNIRNHRNIAGRDAICQDFCEVYVRRYEGGSWFEEKGHFGINIHNPGNNYNSSLGCVIISTDDDYFSEFRPLLRRVERRNNPVAIIRDNKFLDYAKEVE